MERSISDDGDICRQLAELDTTSDIDTTLLSDGAVAVTVTLDRDAPESTIEVEDGEVTDYEIYVGPYRPYDRYAYTVLSRKIRETVTQDALFPNGEFEIHKTHRDGDFTVEFAARSVWGRRWDSRPVEALVDDVETLLDLHETMGRPG